MLNWLKEAEEETEEESDDEIAVRNIRFVFFFSMVGFQFGGDVKESEFLRQQKEKAAREAQQKSAKATNGNAAAASGANDEEDLDIDDI